MGALFFSGAAMAQDTDADCAAAKQYLAEQYSRSDPENNEKYYKIWSSEQCVNSRKQAELHVDSAIAENEQFIRSLSSDYDTRLAEIPAICRPIVEKRWAGASEKFRAKQKKPELLISCIRNRSHALRAEYLNRLNEQSEAQFLEQQRLNREQIAADKKADAERKAAYEMKMEEWRDAVKRCKAGEIRFCAPGS
ncbi:hypothetical protein AZE99_13035 [Sphingorhabdus sp. M41]|nr:hypothetical protein AZE99_13035 [Sphingorhabdus sp. M41]